MTLPETDLHTRLIELETQVALSKRRTRIAIGAGILGAALALVAATDVTRLDTVRAQRIEIIDPDGHVVLVAGSDAAGGRLDVWSPDGSNIARLAGNLEGGDLAIWDSGGTNVAGIWATQIGGTLAAWNHDGDRHVTIAAGAEGGLAKLGGSKEQTQIELASGPIPIVRLVDLEGVERTRLELGNASWNDAMGAPRVILNGGEEASLVVTGEDGRMVTAGITADGGEILVGGPAGTSHVSNGQIQLHHQSHRVQIDAAHDGLQLRSGGTQATIGDGKFTLLDDAQSISLVASGMASGLQSGAAMLGFHEDGALVLEQDGEQVMTVAHGEASTHLQLRTGGGTATLVAGKNASLELAGRHTEAVTIASGDDAAVLTTSDDALRLFADDGAARILLGNGEGGQVRLTGGTDGMRPAVDVLAPGGTRVVSLGTTRQGHGLAAVADDAGTIVGLLHAANGNGGRLMLQGDGGHVVASGGTQTPELALLAPGGRTLAALAATPRGGALNLMNTTGTPVVLAGITEDGPGGAAAFQNGSGTTVVAAGATADNKGRIVVNDK